MNTAISLRDVCKRFPSATRRRGPLYRQLLRYFRGTMDSAARLALDHVSVDIPQGSVVAMVGQNGAGKTTLLRVIGGIYQPLSGERILAGTIACHFGGEAGLASSLTVVDNLYLFGAMLGLTHAQTTAGIESTLALAELPDEHQSRLEHLSFGKQQRLFFAVMLQAMQLHSADIFVFDEWLAGADGRYKERAEELLLSTRAPTQTVIIASHDIERLRRVCNLGLYLNDGRLRCFGGIDEVLDTYVREAR